MPRCIDADAWEPYFYEHMDDAHMAAAKNALDDMPTIDAVEVVRCKVCRWWRDTDHTCREWGGASPRLANAFCSEGERKKE